MKTKSELETYELAKKLALKLKGGDIIFLNGDLGAGKTTFVKGVAKALGIKQNVTSPTFTLLKTYEAKDFTLVHVDAYRLEGSSFEELEEYLSNDNVIFIEWSNYLKSTDFLKNHLDINIKYISKNVREFSFSSDCNKYDTIIKELANV